MFVALVSRVELEKVFDKYYGKFGDVKIGADYSIGAGYDFRADIQSACKKMEDAMREFGDAQATMHRFAVMVSQLPAAESEAGHD